MYVFVHERRAELVFGTLLEALAANRYPYSRDDVRVTQDHRHLPDNLPLGGIEHASFLFVLCYWMRGGIDSIAAAKELAGLYQDCPRLFDFNYAARLDPEDTAFWLSQILIVHGLGFNAKLIAGYWIENAKRIVECYGGDPRRIFDGVGTYNEALARVCNRGQTGFKGFQEKMTSMLLYFYRSEQMIDDFMYAIAVDFHVLRLLVATGALRVENPPTNGNLLSPELKEAARSLSMRYTEAHDCTPLQLSDALWLFSGAMCSVQPGNTMLAPNGRQPGQDRATRLVPLAVSFGNRTQRRAYERSCGLCPIERHCELNVPAAPYYNWGQLLVSQRLRFPLLF